MITAKDFKLVNATTDDIKRLNQALAYLQSDSDMAKVVKRTSELGVEIRFKNNSHNSMYDGCGDVKECVDANGNKDNYDIYRKNI